MPPEFLLAIFVCVFDPLFTPLANQPTSRFVGNKSGKLGKKKDGFATE